MVRIVAALMLREIATRYGRSPGGYLWVLAEPMAGIALLSFIFSITLAAPAIGTNFPLFYASGFLPFAMYMELSGTVARSIAFSRPFLQYPPVTYTDALIARVLLNFVTQIVVCGMIFTGIDLFYGLHTVWNIPALLEGAVLTALLAVGVGVMNCYLFLEFPIWERIWSILMRPLFLISGVFYLYSSMPMAAQNVLWFNPLVHCVALVRRGIYGTYDASYASPAYVLIVSGVLIFFGMLLLNRHHLRLLER
ncbi:sugar ABC transporter permease [Paracoccus suum]|uniref:Transport permease protein n=2 Tax=Paracoccus suum TaxID=2259340 RepID=A0A344PNX3_9RHOB|nr:sugar ABC transporter permease [Paracoccus suum]